MPGCQVVSRCFFIALMLFAAPAWAAGLTTLDLMHMPLEKLPEIEVMVTGASRYAEKASEAPSIVEIITADDIRTYGYQTLADALNGIHGLYASSDQQYTTLGVRGFLQPSNSDSRFLVMIDGHRMNENVYDSAYVGQEFMLDMALVDHIEYISGPGSSIYGANAMMGVINVVTKKGADIGGTQVQAQGGSFFTGEARTTYGRTLANGTDVLMSASGYHSDGRGNIFYPVYNFAFTNFGNAHDMDTENNQRLFAKVQSGGFTYTAGFVDRFKRIPSAQNGVNFNDPGFHSIDKEVYGEAKYHKDFNSDTWVDSNVFYQWYGSRIQFPYNCGADCNYISKYGGDWAGGEATLVTTAFARHKIVTGIDFQYDIDQRLHDFFFTVIQNSNNNGIRAGFYAQDAYSLRDDLTLDAGFRLDRHHAIDGVQLNPRLGLIWKADHATTVRLLYAQAFRAPDVFETDYNFGVPNPSTAHEEHIKNYEAVVEWAGPDRLKLSGSVFYNDFSSLLTKDYNPLSPTYNRYINTGRLKSVGVEAGLEKKWEGGEDLKLEMNHTEFLRYEGTTFGPLDAPKNVGKARFAMPLFDDAARLGVEDIYVAKRLTLYTDKYAHPYSLVNANISSHNILPGLDVSLGVYNLLNSSVDMVGGPPVSQDVLPMPGRTYLATLQKTF